MSAQVSVESVGARAVSRFELSSPRLRAEIVDYGARLAVLEYRSDAGTFVPVILPLPDAAAVVKDRGATGAVCGRFANRIEGGSFELDGVVHRLSANEGSNTLHGGADSFMNRTWEAATRDNGLALSLVSPDGDQGFPGQLQVRVTYTLDGSALTLAYEATTDAPTVLNLTNHTYFTLGCANLLDASLAVDAERVLHADEQKIPTGSPEPVAASAFDLRKARTLRDVLAADDAQLRAAGGLDHSFVLNGGPGPGATLVEPGGISLAVTTSEPAIQIYTANHLTPLVRAICLETQHFPDSPNQPEYPTTVLRPGETFHSTTSFVFSG